MQEATSREKVLKRVRKALINKGKSSTLNVDFESNVYPQINEIPEIVFAQKFTENLGKFVFCENEQEAIETLHYLIQENNWPPIFSNDPVVMELFSKGKIKHLSDENSLSSAKIGMTTCESLVARTGSVFVSSAQPSAIILSAMADVHIVLAYTSQIVIEIKDALKNFKNKYGNALPSSLTMISGPSRTAVIENTIVIGAHGPKEVFLFLLDDIQQ